MLDVDLVKVCILQDYLSGTTINMTPPVSHIIKATNQIA